MPDGQSLSIVAPVDTVVTVVDTEAFPRTLRSHVSEQGGKNRVFMFDCMHVLRFEAMSGWVMECRRKEITGIRSKK